MTTYIKYIISPALYLQTQIIMGTTKKKNTQIRRFLDSGSVVLGGCTQCGGWCDSKFLELRKTILQQDSGIHGGAISSVRVRDSPPPPCPPGPLSYQGSMATGHTYGGAEGARKFCPLCWGPPRMQGFGSISAHLRASKKAGLR